MFVLVYMYYSIRWCLVILPIDTGCTTYKAVTRRDVRFFLISVPIANFPAAARASALSRF